MNTKHLIIAFITVSVAALIVSAFAVFAAARSQYAAILASVSEAEDIRTAEATQAPEPTDSPETSTAPETSAAPETTAEISESEAFTEETRAPEESSNEVSSDSEETSSAPSGYTLKLEGDLLVISDPDGTPLSERIINSSALHPKDREALTAGIIFANESDAISAVYDIIS